MEGFSIFRSLLPLLLLPLFRGWGNRKLLSALCLRSPTSLVGVPRMALLTRDWLILKT